MSVCWPHNKYHEALAVLPSDLQILLGVLVDLQTRGISVTIA
jgi:hypothetical protein